MNAAVKVLTKNIRAAVAAAKKSGTVGMSVGCLKTNASTTGLTCSVAEYHAAFAEAVAAVAKSVRGFRIYA